MKYFHVEPEVAGGLGMRTVMERNTHPPKVSKLHYQLDGWLGDAVLETFPCFVTTRRVREELIGAAATGITFDKVEVTKSDQFIELHPGRQLPEFVWMKVIGIAGSEDIGLSPDFRLVVSERVLKILQEHGIAHALVDPYA